MNVSYYTQSIFSCVGWRDTNNFNGGIMKELIEKVNMWFEDRNLIAGSTDKDQILKLVQELGELSDRVAKR